VLAHPATVDSIPTSANQEDHVSMGSIAARHARAVLIGVERIVAIELVVAAQALDLRLTAMRRELDGRPAPSPGAGVVEAHARIRRRIDHLDRDREPGPDLAAATALVHEGVLADLADLG
jgi:histidine ammonia-lyase